MHPDTLRRLLHHYLPEWDQSIWQACRDLSFASDLGPQGNWEWVAAGNYVKVMALARERVGQLELPGG